MVEISLQGNRKGLCYTGDSHFPFPLHSAAPGEGGTPPASSTLGKAAATFCGTTSGTFLEHTIPYKPPRSGLESISS